MSKAFLGLFPEIPLNIYEKSIDYWSVLCYNGPDSGNHGVWRRVVIVCILKFNTEREKQNEFKIFQQRRKQSA